jgi:hypothetical protein
MLARVALAVAAITVAVAVVSTVWPVGTRDASPPHSDSIFAEILPPGNPMISALDTSYRDLELAMRPHGCNGCHAPDLVTGGRRERVRHAVMLLDTRRALETTLAENLMPPSTDDRPAGISDRIDRARLLHRARSFRALADAALASW